jgi:3-isopropylmalate dehydrogenase
MGKQYKIGFLPGDGIGVDVLEASKAILDVADFNAEYIPLDIGFKIFENEGDALPSRTVEALKDCDAALFGAITSKPRTDPSVQKVEKKFGVTYRSPIVRLRQVFDLYSNMRPSKSYEGNPLNFRKIDGSVPHIDIVTFRENTQGLYSGIEFESLIPELKAIDKFKAFQDRTNASDEDIRVSCRVFTRDGCDRIIRKAFNYAKTTGRNKVTVVHKANVIRATDGLFLETAKKIASEYPEVQWWDENIDATAMWLMKRPDEYSVIVSSNMFGDIITDQAAMLSGGLGFAASASTSKEFGVFEPNHGSAPKYAGQNKVNPIAAIKSIALMWEFLGETSLAEKLESAIAENVKTGKIRTYDMGGSSSTTDVANDIAKIFEGK